MSVTMSGGSLAKAVGLSGRRCECAWEGSMGSLAAEEESLNSSGCQSTTLEIHSCWQQKRNVTAWLIHVNV